MAFSDPVSLTYDSETIALPRTSSGANSGEFTISGGDRDLKLSVSHAYGRRTRRVLRLDVTKIAPDPFVSDVNRSLSMSNYIVFDLPTFGYNHSEALEVFKALSGLASGSSFAAITKVLGGES